MVRVLVLALVLALTMATAQARPRVTTSITGITGAEDQEVPEDRPSWPDRPLRPMTENEIQGVGCLVSAVASTALTYGVGAVEMTQIIAGGSMVASTPMVLFLAVTGTVTLAACGMGAILAPAVVWAYEESDALAYRVANAVGHWWPGQATTAVAAP